MKLRSDCELPEQIFRYKPWHLELGTRRAVAKAKRKATLGARFFLIELDVAADRDAAASWLSAKVVIDRSQFKPAKAGEYYWTDLLGLRVRNLQGVEFGAISKLLETGANDVLVVEGDRQRLVPYAPGQFVISIDLAEGIMVVDWDADF